MTSTASATGSSGTATTPSTGALFLQLLEGDLAADFGNTLTQLGSSITAANGDKVKEAAAVLQAGGNALAEAPLALAGLEVQLATIVNAKVQALLAKAPNPGTVVTQLAGT